MARAWQSSGEGWRGSPRPSRRADYGDLRYTVLAPAFTLFPGAPVLLLLPRLRPRTVVPPSPLLGVLCLGGTGEAPGTAELVHALAVAVNASAPVYLRRLQGRQRLQRSLNEAKQQLEKHFDAPGLSGAGATPPADHPAPAPLPPPAPLSGNGPGRGAGNAGRGLHAPRRARQAVGHPGHPQAQRVEGARGGGHRPKPETWRRPAGVRVKSPLPVQ
jgi:hypothetical protein